MLSLRPMTEQDLPLVADWLREPHLAPWWIPDTTVEAEISDYRAHVVHGQDPATHLLTVSLDGRPVGWCQWYQWADYPPEAAAMEALPGEAGIDYAIGDPAHIGHGTGTALIAALVAEVRQHHPGAGFLTDPDARNVASRRVLEKNGFRLVAVRPVTTEPTTDPMAIYRLPGGTP